MAQLVTVTYILQDAKNRPGKTQYRTDLDNPYFGYGNFNDRLSDAMDYFQEVGRRIDLVTLGALKSIDMSVRIPLPVGIKASPAAAADREEIAKYVFAAAPSSAAYINSIPTFNHGLFGLDQVVTGLSDPDFAYLAVLLGLASEAIDWSTGHGGISDNRGKPVVYDNPLIYKRFRR